MRMEAVLDWCEAGYTSALRADVGKPRENPQYPLCGRRTDHGTCRIRGTYHELHKSTPHHYNTFFKKSILILSPYQSLILPTDLLSSYFPNIIPHMCIVCFLGLRLISLKRQFKGKKIGTRKQNSTGQTSAITTSSVQVRPTQ